MSHAKHVTENKRLNLKDIYLWSDAGRHFRVRDAEWGGEFRSEIRMVVGLAHQTVGARLPAIVAARSHICAVRPIFRGQARSYKGLRSLMQLQ
ncbi:hypothetical protein SAMN05216605_106324 [Pseudomonas abietaniphila]|uniref:Uncharacterized protein n=1 Tax=Pseudomonas abietaniphila TaxID=89065 RepID=A0A1G8CSF9_9PSED|nr:hypothetical protein SAMN05216605_106324 [Pseudomonas abietaniphila]